MSNCSYNTSVNKICKRDHIFAYNKNTLECIEGSGHWNTDDGVCLEIERKNGKLIKKNRKDIVLKNDEWDIYVMVKYEPDKDDWVTSYEEVESAK